MYEAYKSTYIAQFTDTGDDSAKSKIRAAYRANFGRFGIRDADTDVWHCLSTLEIGVKASEQVNNLQRPDFLGLALNCAPPDKKEGTKDNARNDFFYADLGDGIAAGGTSNGFEFSYIKNRIKSLYRLTTTNTLGSQFRSLEVLPPHLVQFMVPDLRKALIKCGDLVEVSNLDDIVPDVPDRTHVIEVDSFQNVKLFMSQADRKLIETIDQAEFCFGKESIEFKPGRGRVTPTFNALVRPSLFAVPLGKNVLTRKSSSRLLGNEAVPMLATMRERPAEFGPSYPVPKVGCPVYLM